MPNAERPVVDSERAHLFGSLVRLAASHEEALALIDKVLGAGGRLSPRELASARREAASCRAQLAAVRRRVDTLLGDGAPEGLTAKIGTTERGRPLSS